MLQLLQSCVAGKMDDVLHEHLQHSKLFANVSLDSVEHLFEGCERRKLERGDHLLEAGATNIHLYLILGGELRVYLQGRDMPEQAVLARGDCVGEMSLLDGRPASALVLAAQDSEVLAIPHEVVWFLVDCSHGVARNLLAIVSGRVRDSNQALVSMQSRSLEFEEAGRVDVLTGMHNRRWLMEAFPRAMGRCERDEEPVCLVLADIDLFRDFNARFGYLTGDALWRRDLRAPAAAGQHGRCPAGCGAPARTGGDRQRAADGRGRDAELRRRPDAAGRDARGSDCAGRCCAATRQGKRPRPGGSRVVGPASAGRSRSSCQPVPPTVNPSMRSVG
jgi:CRP-like cAMP-binding protein